VPLVRQLVTAEGDGLLEEIGRVDSNGDFVDDATSGKAVGDGVTIDTLFGEEDTLPKSGIALTQHNRIVHNELRLVDGELQTVDAVTTVSGGERVVIDAGLGERLASPEVRQRVVANIIGFRHQILLRLVDSERDNTVAKTVAVEGDGIDTRGVEGLVAVSYREVGSADEELVNTLSRGDYGEVDGDKAVAGVH